MKKESKILSFKPLFKYYFIFTMKSNILFGATDRTSLY